MNTTSPTDRTLTLTIHGREHRLMLAPGAEGFGFRHDIAGKYYWAGTGKWLDFAELPPDETLRMLACGHAAWELEWSRIMRSSRPKGLTLDQWQDISRNALLNLHAWYNALRAAAGEGEHHA